MVQSIHFRFIYTFINVSYGSYCAIQSGLCSLVHYCRSKNNIMLISLIYESSMNKCFIGNPTLIWNKNITHKTLNHMLYVSMRVRMLMCVCDRSNLSRLRGLSRMPYSQKRVLQEEREREDWFLHVLQGITLTQLA